MRNGLHNSNIELIDSNILLYAYDENEPAKKQIAKALLRRLTDHKTLGISVQTLNEYYNIAHRPNGQFRLSHERIVEILSNITQSAVVYQLTPQIAFRAYEAIGRYGFSLWDALIWAVAKENGIGIIYTEDAQSAEVIEGVRYINPFTVNEGEKKP